MSLIRESRRFLAQNCKLLVRNMSSEPRKELSKFRHKLGKIAFNLSGFNRYGLYHDDCLDFERPEVADAILRLPGDVLDERNFRIIRALELSALKIVLPKKKWISYEEDQQYRYLRPYIKEIEAENQEIIDFGCVNYRRPSSH